MITLYDADGARLVSREGMQPISDTTLWIDLLDPTPDEDAFIERQLAISVPTRAETREIETSSRLYQENGAHYMTAFVVYNIDTPQPASTTITFILAGNRLVTVRYHALKALPNYLARVDKRDAACTSAAHIMIGLVEGLIHRAADLIEKLQDGIEKHGHTVFEIKGGQQTRSKRLDVMLRAAGRDGDINSRTQESALSLERLLAYLGRVAKERNGDADLQQRVEIAHRDVHSLTEHSRFLADRITFLLDATLGMINIEQNGIIKIFSVASVALMPPTLIASIYGMNFQHMPEIKWPWGYPLALGLMVVSAVLPFLYFRRKGWF